MIFVKMIVYKELSFSFSIFLLLLPYGICDTNANELSNDLKTKHETQYVDPHSFYYNKHTKTQMRIEPRGSGNRHDNTGLIQFSPHQHCNRIFNECVNNKMKDIPDELFSRRIINLLMSVASFERIDDSLIGSIVIEVTPSQLKKLKNFGLGETTIRDIDSMIPNIFKAPEKYLFQDTFSFIKHLCTEAFMHKDIVIGSLVLLYMTWIILTTKWNMLKLTGMTIMIVLAASFVITWLQLLKEAEIKHTVKQMLYTELPSHCQPNRMTWLDKMWMMFSSLDSCHKHYEAMMENPFLQVTPAQALSQMIGTCVLQPAQSIGDALSDFVHHSTKHLPYPARLIIEPLMIVGILVLTILAIICLAGGSIGWGLGPLTLFSLRGNSQSTNSKSINNTERREPVEVILNVKVTQDGGTHQLAIEALKQKDNATVTLLENEVSTRLSPQKQHRECKLKIVKTQGSRIDSASVDSSSLSASSVYDKCDGAHESEKEETVTELGSEIPKTEQLVLTRQSPLRAHRECKPSIPKTTGLKFNPASGDSSSSNTSLVYDKCRDAHESEIEENVAELGSGDN